MMTLEEALAGKEMPLEIRQNQALLDLPYWGFDGEMHQGQLVIQRELAAEVQAIFAEIAQLRFPIAKMVPVVAYAWSDDDSMADNNSSAFNYRFAQGKPKLSYHAYGRAIDINPVQNPYIKGELVLPPGAVYNPEARGTLLGDGPVVAVFEKRGWTWGGRWQRLSDWHHFEKADAQIEALAAQATPQTTRVVQ
ncbi:MAG: hypothetical protein JWN98_2316 [Abditibacteriota bacterium]|jgi:peptidoglycan L-alanyl-D-glutamate endopeptidase CwlK|nr:hypothetical protein [Abditibacteriota bacterium]